MFIPVILGTARKGRQSEKVASLIFKETQKRGFQSELIDIKDYPQTFTNNTGETVAYESLSDKMGDADGYIIVSPEYNHGFPGELKMFLDNFYPHYFKKPIGFCGVSAGILGGARAVELLRLVAVELHLVPIREALYFPVVQEFFDEHGEPKDPSFYNRCNPFFEELAWYAKALREARENI